MFIVTLILVETSLLLVLGATEACYSSWFLFCSYLTVSELERELERSRAQAGPREPVQPAVPESKPDDAPSTVPITGLPSSKVDQIRPAERNNQKISGGYFPSIIAADSRFGEEHLVAVKAALLACGYEPADQKQCPNVMSQSVYKWKVTMRTFDNRAIQLHLGEKQVCGFFCWVFGIWCFGVVLDDVTLCDCGTCHRSELSVMGVCVWACFTF